MRSALNQFRTNLNRARDLGALATAVIQLTTTAVDVSDMWRAQIVLGVSALDYLVHEVARIGMIESSNGPRPKTDAFLRYPFPLEVIEKGIMGQPPEVWLSEAVRQKHSWLSFQHPNKIADAIRLISAVSLWEEVGNQMSMPAADVRLRLELIVDRRNKIAHEADMDPTNPGFLWPISGGMANDALDFIENVAEAIFIVVV